MSGLELVASIAGVAAAAIKFSVSMNDLAEELGSAGRDVRFISNDMAGFSQVLRLVQSSLEESIKTAGSTVIQSVFDTLPQLVEQCNMVYEEANGLMVALKPSTSKDPSMSFLKRVKFIFYKGRITILRSLLDSSKSTLNLLLVTLNIEMAKDKSPDKALMDQLQNERKAFIRVVYSQNKALDEAMKEIEKAKKEALKFKIKRDKEKEKDKDKKGDLITDSIAEDSANYLPGRQSTPYSYKPPPPPPPYTLHSAPSVSQLVYQPPSLERINSVRKSSNAVTRLALSLEPAGITSTQSIPTPPTSPPDNGPYGTYSPHIPDYPPTSPASSQTKSWGPSIPRSAKRQDFGVEDNSPHTKRPNQSGKRVFSDPGPAQMSTASSEHLSPGSASRERSRSPYGFSRVPEDDAPKVERNRPSFQSPPQSTRAGNAANHRTFSTPAYGSSNMGSVPEEPECIPASSRNATTPPVTEPRKPSFTYHPPPPPPPPAYSDPETSHTQQKYVPPQSTANLPRRPSIPPPPPPRHGTIYIALASYITHEIGHLSLVPFDILVDVTSYTPEDSDLPYPTAFDTVKKQYWQASLGNRRGPRGFFPCDVVCPIDDDKVTHALSENWLADAKNVGFIADGFGRCWVGKEWERKEPVRRRSKWWAEEF